MDERMPHMVCVVLCEPLRCQFCGHIDIEMFEVDGDKKTRQCRLCCEESEFENRHPSAEADDHSNFGLM